MTVGQLTDRLTIHELQDWQAFCQDHPLPADLLDIHGAMLCALTANINRTRETRPFDVADFLVVKARRPPPPKPAKPKMTEAQRIRAFFENNGGG